MSEKRRGLGRGLGALIPSSAATNGSGNGGAVSRPVDLFFPEGRRKTEPTEQPTAAAATRTQEAETPTTPPSSVKPAASKAPAGKSSDDKKAPAAAPAPAKKAPARKSPAAASKAAAAEPSAIVEDPEVPKRDDPLGPEEPAETGAAPDSGVELVEVPGARFAEIPVSDIHPNRKQPRNVFDEDDMAELVHSVREIGVLQPIVVRTSTETGSEPYELVMGERRWRAVQAAGLDTIPAIIRDTTDDDLLRDALLENLHRSQLNPLEEAAAYQQLLEDFGTTHEQLADRIGRSRPQVSNTLRLLKLPPLVQRRVAAGVLSAGHARALLSLPDAAAMERLAQRIVAEGMSVRATEEAVTLYQDPAKPAKNNIPRPGARHERLDYLASSLSDRLDTNVKISLGVRKGKVSIEFASVEDLNRIMDVLAPGSTN
ncbi:ParB/RepB/Spo0J family partition protein [Arthrobacter sp. FW306-06-A]|uniref:ParB/RepB/Spo0J family partition protein n=1 Tax=Arthrobacter sp. FW306-06-A TaxID=2879621 RepID=UPI001F01330D|nr:ParB/RepB/Spo0J family partition protein [Arthrobacter sp. FW306-06-A]UKA71178.1 ParB/RepB/Spo0J family partition protein [Arthrobacter sp. FW306-06-A]